MTMDKSIKCRKRFINLTMVIFLFLVTFFLLGFKSTHKESFIKKLPRRATVLPDLSGLAWVSDDLFLAVHDAKNPEEKNLPRISLLKLPEGLDGVRFNSLHPNFHGPRSDDFESIAKIPDTQKFLLVESSSGLDHDKPFSHRIFLAEFNKNQIKIIDMVEWPFTTNNIEGTAVAKVGKKYIFIFAERAHGKSSTDIRYANLSLNPLTIDSLPVTAGSFTIPGVTDPTHFRPVSAIDVYSNGAVYVVSAYDPDDDNGPFKSMVYKIGTVESDDGTPYVELYIDPESIAVLDGIKVESIAFCERNPDKMELFVGTDDENYGGIIRPIPLD